MRLTAGHPAISALLTRYRGEEEAAIALKMGKIPNVSKSNVPRPTHFTRDEPTNNPKTAASKYEIGQPTHRATVTEERVPNVRVPSDGPTTIGGGSQVITEDSVMVFPGEIVPLESVPIDPMIF